MLHHIPKKRLGDSRPPDSYSTQEKKFFKLVKLHNKVDILPVGSFSFKIQSKPSDIDIQETAVYSGKKIAREILSDIKNIINRMDQNGYFSDFKAGMDSKGESIHWTKSEIKRGNKTINGKKYSLKDALLQKSIIKLDYFVKLRERFVEFTTFFILQEKTKNGKKYINTEPLNIQDLVDDLKKDIIEYQYKNPFKAVKRLWSMSRITGNNDVLKKLAPLLNSNLSVLSQINADFETIMLMIEKLKKLPRNSLSKMIDGMKERITHVIDIQYDEDWFDSMIDSARKALLSRDYHSVISILTQLKEYLKELIDKYTIDYLTRKGLWPLA